MFINIRIIKTLWKIMNYFPQCFFTSFNYSSIALVGRNGVGKTNIINAAREPEIIALGDFLIKLGAKIEGLGTDNITITPIENENNNIEYNIINWFSLLFSKRYYFFL